MAEKERLLRKLIPPCRLDVSGSNFTVGGADWEIVEALDSLGNPTYWAVFRDFFDLSGLVKEQETLFTISPVFQEGTDWDYVTSKSTGGLQVWDMITQEYLTDSTFNGVMAGSGSWIPPGMMSTLDDSVGPNTGEGYDLQDVHYGNARTFAYGALTSLGTSPFHPIMTRSTMWGTGAATAGRKLYITRAIHLDSAFSAEPLNQGTVPATAVVVPALITKEPDLQYIERLRRSYVIAPTVE
jgi:hypothetical protein